MRGLIIIFTLFFNHTFTQIENNDTKNVILQSNSISGINVLTQEMFKENNARYIIKQDYDLLGKSITIPPNCTLCFDGGSIKNGNFLKSYVSFEK